MATAVCAFVLALFRGVEVVRVAEFYEWIFWRLEFVGRVKLPSEELDPCTMSHVPCTSSVSTERSTCMRIHVQSGYRTETSR